MQKIPHILHFVTGDHPNQTVVDRIKKITSLHPTWKFYHWRDSNPPDSGRLSKYYRSANSGAELADLMRLDAVWAFGGIYIDSDFSVELPLDPIADNYDFFIASEDGDYLTNALFGATPSHPGIDAIVQALLDDEPDWTKPANEATGPFLFERVCHWRTDVDVLPRETFYPYNWWETPRASHRLSYGTHLWDGSWITKKEVQAKASNSVKKTVGTRLQVELAKFLSTIGMRAAGAVLWDKAHGIEKDHPAAVAARGGSYTIGDEVFVHTVHGNILVCDGRDLSITPHLALNGHYELPEELFLKRTLSGGDWFVDVGANIGNHAILAASRVGPFGRVFAFEPNERCFSLMRKSAIVNWVHDRLRVLELGVSDTLGTAKLNFSATQLGGASIDTGTKKSDCLDATMMVLGDEQTILIETTTLDATFPVDLPIKVLKIDAEGHEPAILRGAGRLLSKRSFDYILVEAIAELAGTRWVEHLAAFRQLIDHGYQPARLSADGLLRPHPTLESALLDTVSRTLVFHVPA